MSVGLLFSGIESITPRSSTDPKNEKQDLAKIAAGCQLLMESVHHRQCGAERGPQAPRRPEWWATDKTGHRGRPSRSLGYFVSLPSGYSFALSPIVCAACSPHRRREPAPLHRLRLRRKTMDGMFLPPTQPSNMPLALATLVRFGADFLFAAFRRAAWCRWRLEPVVSSAAAAGAAPS